MQVNWAAYLSTDPSTSPEKILEAVSDRWAIEKHFHDVTEIWGVGQQQVRNLWSNVGCWNLCGWLYTVSLIYPRAFFLNSTWA